MLDWKTRFGRQVVSADAAVCGVRCGQRVFIGSGAAEPQTLVAALTRRGSELADTEIIHILTLGIAPYTDARLTGAFRHNAFFIGANVRSAIAEGRADYTPILLSEIPRLFRSKRLGIDVALIQVSPPDEQGFCSYGVSVDIVKAAAESADCVVAQVNPQMPRTLGDCFIHLDQIDYLVEHDAPLLESVPAVVDDLARQIGQNVARLIDDGSTLQIGIGRMPNTVLQCLGGKKDLGIHTEMFSDGVIDLIERGVINGARKTLLPGKVVSSFCLGTRRLYDYLDNNPFFEFHPVEFTNNVLNIASNFKMAAINSAFEVDLTGQVCADTVGSSFYAGIGGQADFMRGAALSEGGKPIIVLPSTAQRGAVSRIVPELQAGAGVVTTRGDVHYVVTEWGTADLWGKSVRDRALALISIAHPRFRAGLLEEAKRRRLVYQDQMLESLAAYPAQWETEMALRSGARLFVRPVRPTDEPLLKDMIYSCSEQTLYRRFFETVKAMPHSKLQKLVNVDYVHDMSVVVLSNENGRERMVASGYYGLGRSGGLAEVAFLVQDEYQGQGIGTFLLNYLIRIAQAQGITGFTAEVQADNRSMLHVFDKSGLAVLTSLYDQVYQLVVRFETAAR